MIVTEHQEWSKILCERARNVLQKCTEATGHSSPYGPTNHDHAPTFAANNNLNEELTHAFYLFEYVQRRASEIKNFLSQI